MKVLVPIISGLLLFVILACPFIILFFTRNRKPHPYSFLVYTFLSFIAFGSFVLVFAWWDHYSTNLLLSTYGYDLNLIAGNRFENVAVENIEVVKTLHIKRMGIGWTLKALLFYGSCSPYLIIVHILHFVYKKLKENNLSTTITTNKKTLELS